jgi:hypothetical protein
MSSRGGGSPRLETLPAKYRAALRGTEGHSGFLAALGAGGASLDLGVVEVLAWRWRRAEHGHALRLAGFAALGFVLELFIVKKQLFPGGKNKIGAAVDTLQYLVLKFHRGWLPSARSHQPKHGRKLPWQRDRRLFTSPSIAPWTRPTTHRGECADTDLPLVRGAVSGRTFPAATRPGGGQIEQSRPGEGAALSLLQSCSLRVFLRARLRASAAFTRFFSPGFR